MDEDYEKRVLSILRGGEGCDEKYSSISEFKEHLKETSLAEEKLNYGWVIWRESEIYHEQQQLDLHQSNNSAHQLQQKIKTLLKHMASHFWLDSLVQFWGVVKVEGRHHYLSTSHHPFYVTTLKKGICWYRKACKDQVYRVDMELEEQHLLNGVVRAYRSKHPESTPDLRLYSAHEFPLRDEAARCGFRTYMALPLFDLHTNQSYGVLEFLSSYEPNCGLPISLMFDRQLQQHHNEMRKILELAIRAVPRLSLAQVWIPCKHCPNMSSSNLCCMEMASSMSAENKVVGCYYEFYDDDDKDTLHYLEACKFHNLQIDRTCSLRNMSDLSISKSPLAHYAKKARLSHCLTICLQSVNDSNAPFVIIQFFLQRPFNSSLHLLLRIIEMKLKSFKFVLIEQLPEELVAQSRQPNAIEWESIDMLNVMKENFSESDFTTYLETSCCQRPSSEESDEEWLDGGSFEDSDERKLGGGWVFRSPVGEKLIENYVQSNLLITPSLIKEKIEHFMKQIALKFETKYCLVQFWIPKIVEDRHCLETADQPYVVGCLAKGLASFRKKCTKHHYFVDDEAKEEELGPPGRVFRNKHPEISPSLYLYSTEEFSMRNYAAHYQLEEYFALPVFDKQEHKCVGVLEFIGISFEEWYDLGVEEALKEATLRSSHIDFRPRFIANDDVPDNIAKALTEVEDAFSLIAEIPQLHLAKVWVPYENCASTNSNMRYMELALTTQDSWEFEHANKIQWIDYVQPKKGMIGMLLESENKSCFCRNLSEFSITDQPLAHLQRKKRHDVCFAICLQSSHTGDLLYVVEFFLYQGPATHEYLRSFLNYLLPVMKRELKTFKMACGKQLGEELVIEVIEFSEASTLASSDSDQPDMFPIKFKSVRYDQKEDQQVQPNSKFRQRKQLKDVASNIKKTEKGTGRIDFGLEDIMPHLGKKLKDVADDTGFSRTTIKRRLRESGVVRWPSNKKQAKNLSLFKRKSARDPQQDIPPSSSSSLQLQKKNEYNDDDIVQLTDDNNTLQEEAVALTRDSTIAANGTVVSHNEQSNKAMELYKGPHEKKVQNDYASLPVPLKMLCSYAEHDLNDGSSISIALDNDVFGDKCKICVFGDDIIPFCNLEPISGNCIVLYIWHLYNKIKQENSTIRRFQFVNPFDISNGIQLDSRAKALAKRLIAASPDQLVLVPCNIGQHWILTVIHPYEEVVSFLDPFYHCICNQWELVVNMAMSIFNAYLKKDCTTKPTWKIIKVPRQPDLKQCGYYVMCYMKSIIQDLNYTFDSSSLSSLFVREEYSLTHINEVRVEWALCLQVHAHKINTQVARSTIKRTCREYGIDKWPNNTKQARNPSLFERNSVGDPQQDLPPSNLQLRDVKLLLLGKDDDDDDEILLEEDVTLTTDSTNAMVANGAVVSHNEQSNMLHGDLPFPMDCTLVSIDKAVNANASLPIQNPSVMELNKNVTRESNQHVSVQDEAEKVMIRVKYEEDTIKFELCLSLGVNKLFEEVVRRLNLKMGSFKLKYVDEDNEEILITCDDDLQLCPKSKSATGKTCVQMFVSIQF